MKAIILAGGKATRLSPLSFEMPKPLITVHREPIINRLIRLFWQNKTREIAVIISPDWQKEFCDWREKYFSRLEPRIKFVIEEEPMGTFGGAKHYLERWLRREPFFLTNGDELKELDLVAMRQFHQKQKNIVATIALAKVPNPQDYGVAILAGAQIKEFMEKPSAPPSNYISSGLYLLEPEIFDLAPKDQKFIMIEKDIFPALAQQNKLAGYKFKGQWFDCGTFERWEIAIKNWKE